MRSGATARARWFALRRSVGATPGRAAGCGCGAGADGTRATGPHAARVTAAATPRSKCVTTSEPLLPPPNRHWVVFRETLIIKALASVHHNRAERDSFGGVMRKPRPNTYNPAQALHLITNDRTGTSLSCPSCSGSIERDPMYSPPPPRVHVTLRCTTCGRFARYIAGAA
jgi:hypothetical protein